MSSHTHSLYVSAQPSYTTRQQTQPDGTVINVAVAQPPHSHYFNTAGFAKQELERFYKAMGFYPPDDMLPNNWIDTSRPV